jgi:hypothetical protein
LEEGGWEASGERGLGERGVPETLPAPWVRGACVGWDEGEKTRKSLSLWVTVWGATTGGHCIALAHRPPRTSSGESVGARVGEETPDAAVERAAGGRRDRCRRRAPAVGAGSRVEVSEADRGSMTAVSSASLRSHSSSSSKTTCQMSSSSVETSWSVTTPSNHRRPNFIRTLRPMKG